MSEQKLRGGIPRSFFGRPGVSSGLVLGLLGLWLAGEGLAAGPVSRIFPAKLPKKVSAVAFSPSAPVMALAGSDQSVRLVNAADGSELRYLESPSMAFFSLAFDNTGFRLAGGADNLVLLWDPASGKVLKRIQAKFGKVRALAFSPGGTRLAVAGTAGSVHILNAATLKHERSLDAGEGPVLGLAFSADGHELAAACGSKARVWPMVPGREPYERGALPAGVVAVAFGEGRRLLTGGRDGSISVWDADQSKPVKTQGDQKGAVFSLSSDIAGKLVASFAQDGSIVLRKGASGEAFLRMEGETSRGQAGVLSPDGRFMACAMLADSGSLKLWAIDRKALTGEDAPATAGLTGGFLPPLEAAVVLEMNRARSSPSAYADELRAYKTKMEAPADAEGGTPQPHVQGLGALIDAALPALSRAAPLPPLMPLKGLCTLASQEGGGQLESRLEQAGGQSSILSEHSLSGPSDARLITITLLAGGEVEEGSRRDPVLSSEFKAVGIVCRPIGENRVSCRLVFADDFREIK